MSRRSGYHADIAWGVEEMLSREPEWLPVCHEIHMKLKNGFYAARWENMFVQDEYSTLDMVDGYLWGQLWHDITMGDLIFAFFDVGAEPGADKGKENPKLLNNLSSRLFFPDGDKSSSAIRVSARWCGGTEIGDGAFEWLDALRFERNYENQHHSFVEIGPRWVPLEVGSTKLTTTFYHLTLGRGLARWPYGSREIGVFVRPPGWVSPLERALA